jgi:hypothetical protein
MENKNNSGSLFRNEKKARNLHLTTAGKAVVDSKDVQDRRLDQQE